MSTDPSMNPARSDGADIASRDMRLHPVEWTVRAGAVEDVLSEMNRRVRRRTHRRFIAMAGAAVVLLTTGLVWQQTDRARTVEGAARHGSVVVSIPERRTLADGSVIELRNGARIAVEFTAATRRVVILEGEAHFDVAKNPQRPFVVAAGAVNVRAVGTAFVVNRGATEIEVLVHEGRVAVERAAPATNLPSASAPATADATAAELPPLALVDAGSRVIVDRDFAADANTVAASVTAVSEQELSIRLAWRVPRLEFSGTPLAEAVTSINRHSRTQIALGDASLGQVRISGILRADNLDTLLRLLEEEHGLRAERRSATEVVLRRER